MNVNRYKLKLNHLFLAAFAAYIASLFFSSCKDFIEVDLPITQQATGTVYTNDETSISVLNGIYSRMISSSGFASGHLNSITFRAGMSADEFMNFNPSNEEFSKNALTINNSIVNILWKEPYDYIFTANAVVEGLSSTEGVTEGVKKQLEGEAKFIRAFCYFYLVNLFGDVPLHLTTDFRNNSVASRTSKLDVYNQIILDLKDAQSLLSDDYSFSGGERTRPNQTTATSLLARVFLYTKDWVNAEAETTAVIDNPEAYSLPEDLNDVFLANSTEAIWQLAPTQPGFNTNEARVFILTAPPTNAALNDEMLDVFESGDGRKTSWVNSFTEGTDIWYYPFKYKVPGGDNVTEYSMIFRLAEQYLIRAEARAEQGNIIGAQFDLNTIRNRAGLPNTTANDKASLLLAIEQERRVELFAEWGHRWLDLKRTNRADIVLDPIKAPDWQSTDVLYPIPERETTTNPNVTQNEGY